MEGESGVGAALLGQHLGYHVFVSDKGTIGESYQKELDDHYIQWEQGQHTSERIIKADLVVKSPGIPPNVPIVEEVRCAKIPLLSEIEFASLHTDAELIGITGTNGKNDNGDAHPPLVGIGRKICCTCRQYWRKLL